MSSNDDQFDDGLEDFGDVAVDEFGNDIEPGEDSFAEEEDWDSYDEQGEDVADDQPAPQSGKKSGNFNKIVIGLALLAGVGVLFFQLSQGPTSAPAPGPVTAPAPVASIPAPASPPTPDVATPTGGFLTSPENMAALEQDIAKTYSNTEVAEFDETDTGAVQSAENAVAPPMPTAMTQSEPSGMDDLAPAEPAVPVVPQGAEQGIRMPNAADVLIKPPAEQGTAVAAVPAPAVSAPVTAPSSEIISKIDLVLARLDQLEGDVKMLKAREEPVSAATIDGLKASLAALEKKVNAAEKARPSATKPAPEEGESRPPKPQILGASPAPAESKPAASPKTAPKAAIQWVLKGAQPGRAMVSRPGESEMRNVAVGDTLPGIGRITGISYQDGRWLVQGTEGRITQ